MKSDKYYIQVCIMFRQANRNLKIVYKTEIKIHKFLFQMENCVFIKAKL